MIRHHQPDHSTRNAILLALILSLLIAATVAVGTRKLPPAIPTVTPAP